jgi:phosphoserine phosphatase RsbU/P
MSDASQILVIEDSQTDARVVSEFLLKATLSSFTPIVADTLELGLERLRAGNIDAILLDLSLGDNTGLDTFIRVHAGFPEVPIVILTGLEDEALAVEAVHRGAQDYLVKHKMDAHSLVRALRYAIERDQRLKLELSLRATDAELRTARQVQRSLFPAAIPALEGFDLAGAWHPAQAVCGDFFDFVPMRDNYLGIALGDVCGHGLGPALVMASTRACLRTLALIHVDVGHILTIANRMLADDLAGDRFVTLFFARLDLKTGLLSYAGAGHRAYLIRALTGVQILDSTSMPLGLDCHMTVPTAPEVTLSPGDQVLFLTDGVEEATSPQGESFGLGRVLDILREHGHESAQCIVEHIIHKALREFTRSSQHDDDFTAVLLKVLSRD